MRRFDIVQSDTDELTSHSGLALVGRALRHTDLDRDLQTIPLRHGIAHADCVKSYVGLLCTAKSDFDAIENRRQDTFFSQALDITKVPSAPSLRQRFDEHASDMIPIVDAASTDFLVSIGAPVTPVRSDKGATLRAVRHKYVALDIDVFPMDNSETKKEGVSYTYKGFTGYAPLAAYLGEEGKRVGVFSAVVAEEHGGEVREFRRVMRITERTIDRDGNTLLVPQITVEGWWTSLEEVACPDLTIIDLYCAHATSEQFHSEFKTDLDIERLPSGKFATNDLVMACAVLAYNILRWTGLVGLLRDDAPIRREAKRRRLRTVIQELMYVAARVIESGRRLALKFSSRCPAFPSFEAVYGRLAVT